MKKPVVFRDRISAVAAGPRTRSARGRVVALATALFVLSGLLVGGAVTGVSREQQQPRRPKRPCGLRCLHAER